MPTTRALMQSFINDGKVRLYKSTRTLESGDKVYLARFDRFRYSSDACALALADYWVSTQSITTYFPYIEAVAELKPKHVGYQVKSSLQNPNNCFATAVIDIEGFHWEDKEFECYLPLNSTHSDGDIREEIWRRFNNMFK